MNLACGIDFAEALHASFEKLSKTILHVERILERERLKGMRRHWSYDLNRHIALKQALDKLRQTADQQSPQHGIESAQARTKANGAWS